MYTSVYNKKSIYAEKQGKIKNRDLIQKIRPIAQTANESTIIEKSRNKKKSPDQGKNNPFRKYVIVFPNGVASSVGRKNFLKVTVENLNRLKAYNQQEEYVQASKLYKLPNIGMREVPVGPTFEVDPVGSKPSASCKASKLVTQFIEAYTQ